MGTVKVLGTSALMAYLENESGGAAVKELLLQASYERPLLMSVVNWGEIYYLTRRKSPEQAEEVLQFIEGLPLQIIDANREQTRLAAEIKANGGISYADCFGAALAKLKNAIIVTKDREFERLEGFIKVLWI